MPTNTPTADEHRRFMAMAVMLAKRGLGRCAPNPSVGAVVVSGAGRTAQVVGRGWTQAGGRPHAETEALDRAGAKARGATIYVTLEPCSHHGETPPCAEAIIKAGIARAVVGVLDPDRRVEGRGLTMLRDAGIEVIEGVLADEARWVTAGHIQRVRSGRPFVQMKLAVSANDLVSHAQDGAPVWVTGRDARAEVHMLRARADAVLTGIGTVLADDPELTCRLPGMGTYSPVRVVLDRKLRLPMTSKLVLSVRDVPVWVMCARRPDATRVAALEACGVEVIPVAAETGGQRHLRWAYILRELSGRGITRAMVEAGPKISRSIDEQFDAVDEYVVFRGTSRFKAEQGTPLLDIWSKNHLDAMPRIQHRMLAGGDTMTTYRRGASLAKLAGS